MRVFVFAVLLSAFFVSYGQFEDKKWIVGADFGSQINISDLVFYPNVAYAITPNTIIGISGSGNDTSRKTQYPDDNTAYEYDYSTASLNLYVKKYKSISDKWYFNVKMSGGVNWSYNRNVYRDIALDEITDRNVAVTKGFGASITPGLSFKPLTWMIVEGNLGYIGYSSGETEWRSEDATIKSSQFNSSIAFGSLGVKFIL